MSDIFKQSQSKSNEEPNLSDIFKQGKDAKSVSSDTIDVDNVQDLLRAYNFRPQAQITNQSEDEDDFELQVVEAKKKVSPVLNSTKQPSPKINTIETTPQNNKPIEKAETKAKD